MKITDLLTRDTITLDLQATSKDEVLNELAVQLDRAGKLNDVTVYREAINKRETESTTGVGDGIAIPHAKTSAVKEPAIAFGRSEAGVDYNSLDGQPAYLFFMIAASEGANNEHLETLSKLSTYLIHEDFRNSLMEAKSKDDIIALFEAKESGEDKPATSEVTSSTSTEAEGRTKLLAVTACPTGIAHTYMAADALKQKAEALGYEIKVQTNGSTGIKNQLTAEEIAEAKGIIVAADTKVDMAPFAGKRVVEAPVNAGIRNPEGLIMKIINGEAPIYGDDKSYQDQISEGKAEKKSRQPAFYRHLMNGVSNMLPFVVGGGILIALSFFWGIHSADPHSNQYNAFAHALNFIGGSNAMALLVPILAGFIASSIAERPGFAPGAVGGFMAAQSNAGFLGGLIAGFLAGYVVLLLKKMFERLPQSLEGLKPVLIFPVLGIFITGIIMYLIDQPIGDIMNGITHLLNSLGTTNLVLLGIVLGGMMAIDMGGPINKAAYTFGLALIAAGNFHPQAATMAGGMVPPLGMALATTLFAKKFTRQERDAGKTAYALGASFITEGAIPFAAADPYRVIISSVIGAALAGGLSQLFNIGLRAPHGGIFVVGIVNGNALLYILSIVTGAVVTGLIYGFWKKPLN